MLEGSDAKTETVRGLLLPSPMTIEAREWGSGLPQLSAPAASSYESDEDARRGLTKREAASEVGGG